MNRLQAELQRLYLLNDQNAPGTASEKFEVTGPDGRVRLMVLALARPADWATLLPLWRGVQTDLELPAPAIAVCGSDGFQLWFSLAEPTSVAEAQSFLEALRLRYLKNIIATRIGMMPCRDDSDPAQTQHVKRVPALQADTGRWSAFVLPDLASVFSDTPWLDICPSPTAQADVLSRLESIKPADFQAALERLNPAQAEATSKPALETSNRVGHQIDPANTGSIRAESSLGPQQFLLGVMNNHDIALALRIEAAKALLPYFEVLRRS